MEKNTCKAKFIQKFEWARKMLGKTALKIKKHFYETQWHKHNLKCSVCVTQRKRERWNEKKNNPNSSKGHYN